VSKPAIPVLQNADVANFDDPEAIKAALVKQLHSPVRWVETMQSMAQQGIQAAVECGPGKVLVGLNKRIVSDMKQIALTDKAMIESEILELKQ
jgi:[acyl-carrier-protein] S-malonyltransferase